MIQTHHNRLQSLQNLVQRAAERIRELEAENKRRVAEVAFLEKETGKTQHAARRHRLLADGQERIQKRLKRLRDKLEKLEV